MLSLYRWTICYCSTLLDQRCYFAVFGISKDKASISGRTKRDHRMLSINYSLGIRGSILDLAQTATAILSKMSLMMGSIDAVRQSVTYTVTTTVRISLFA